MKPKNPTEEYAWEMDVLYALEVDCFVVLFDLGIPGDQWVRYVAFAKRLWEKRVHFSGETYEIEAAAIYNEYVLRGYPLATLQVFEPIAIYYAGVKMGILLPGPDAAGPLGEGLAGVWNSVGSLAEGLAAVFNSVGCLSEGLAGVNGSEGALGEGLAGKINNCGAVAIG